MAVPSFGPSQRIEISRTYLHGNETNERTSGHRVYDTINPKDNVAEEGQVVLLYSDTCESRGAFFSHTFVIPDAAGYTSDVDISQMAPPEKNAHLAREISMYNVGVNQVEKGVKSPHTHTGTGWDISFTPGHPVTIKNTGHEPISRFDLIGIRFPTDEDTVAQANVWAQRGGQKGNCVAKFATYPIHEDIESLKSQKFAADMHTYHDKIVRGFSGADDPLLEFMQVPSLLRLIQRIVSIGEEEMEGGRNERDPQAAGHDFTSPNIDNEDQEHSEQILKMAIESLNTGNMSVDREILKDLMMDGTRVEQLKKLASAACQFVSTLRPPFILAQCIDFRGAQPHCKRVAECGDAMKCVLLGNSCV